MAIKVSLQTKVNKRAERAIEGLKDGYVKVGWIKGEKYKNGMLVAENAYMQENGFTVTLRNGKKIYVKPRPFLTRTLSKNSKSWQSLWKELYKSVLDRKTTPELALIKLGIRVKRNIQDTIATSDGIRPNTPSTLQAKRSKGSPPIPLMDTLRMFNSINYETKIGK